MDRAAIGVELGDYHLVREVGRGAMGVVWEALHRATGRRVALKLLVFPALLPESERAALIVRFAREALALAAVRHRNVVAIHEVGEVDGQPYMAMEYVTGINARERLLREGPLPPAEVIALGEQLCDALAAVHAAGIIHRDVKPDNVVLEPDGKLRLTDFGIARLEVEASLTRTGGLIGSPAYMAPEQILGQPVDARSDLFSAGVTLYQLLTGELPFQGAHLMEVAHRVAYEPPRSLDNAPAPLAPVILRALEKEPDSRYPDAMALREALHAARRVDAEGQRSVSGSLITVPDDGLPTVATTSAAAVLPRSPDCFLHPARPAMAVCVECSRPVCSRCVRYRLGQVWCHEHGTPRARPVWVTRLEVLSVGVLVALLLWALLPLRW